MFLFSFLFKVVSVQVLFPDQIVERCGLYPIRIAKGWRVTHFQARGEKKVEFYIE
jgi:hypothetical protein